MSLYRAEMQMGVLVVTKRKLLRIWKWSFNRSLEDTLTIKRDRLASLNTEIRTLRRVVPRLEAELKLQKERLVEQGGVSRPWVDSWSLRRRPVRSKEPKGPPPKRKDLNRQKPAVLASLVVPQRKP